jgi:hypothetical protein
MRPKVLKKPTGHPNFNNLFSITLIINILQNNFFVLRKTGKVKQSGLSLGVLPEKRDLDEYTDYLYFKENRIL